MSARACPRCGSALVPQSIPMDGVVWANERCNGRGCLYETQFRLAVAPRLLNLLGATAEIDPADGDAAGPRRRRR